MHPLRLVLPFSLLLAGPALTAEDTAPRGWFSSGWPAALADAACDDDMACIARLRACGPEATDCVSGVSYCSLMRGETHIYETACQTDRTGDAVTAHVPSRTVVEMTFGTAPTLDGAPAEVTQDACLHRTDTSETFCARPITQPHTLRAWAGEDKP